MPDEDQAIIDDVQKELGELGLDTDSTEEISSPESQEEELEAKNSTDEEEDSADDSEEESEEDDSEEEEQEEDSSVEDDSDEEESPQANKAKDAYTGRRDGRRLNTIEQGLAKLTEMVSKLADGGNPATSQQSTAIADRAKEFAKKHGTTPEAVIDLIEGFKDVIVPPEVLEKIETSQNIAQDQVEKTYFNKEWGTLEDQLSEEFPNASPVQLAKAKKLMDQYAHTVGIGGTQRLINGKKVDVPYALDYILYKNRKKFEEVLFSPKKKSAESGTVGLIDAEGEDDDSEGVTIPKQEDMTPKKAAQLQAQLSEMEEAEDAGGLEIQREGNKLRV